MNKANFAIQLIILVSGTIITGCLNSIFTKYQDMQCVSHCDDPELKKDFEQPVLQTLQMFLGESLSWVVLFLLKIFSKRTNEYLLIDGKPDINFKSSFLLAIPACCDITGTTLMNLGLIYTPVSIYQMTRGSVVLFVAGMSMIFLSKKITRIEWLSLFTVSLGVVIVGLSGSSNTQEGDKSPEQVIFGTLLILIAEIFIAAQFVVEEFIISKYNVVPLKLVAFEGTFGGIITFIIMIFGHLIYGRTLKGQDGPLDIVNAFNEMFSSKIILYTSVAIMISIGSFNFFGISITNKLSATARSTIDTCRTLLVWIISIYIGWESFKFSQFTGFILLVLGTLVFNGVVDLNELFKLPKFLTVDQPNNQRVIDAIDEQIERF